MERAIIQDAIVNALTEIQVNSGRALSNITGNTRPIGDLMDFDSLNAVEAACLVSEALGTDIETELLLTSSYGVPLTVNEMVDRITNHFDKQEGVNHGQLKFPTKFNRR